MPKPLNGTYYTKEDDALMVTTPEEWPRWPFLPLKKSISEVGFMYGDPQPGEFVVHVGNYLRPRTELADLPKAVYPTAQALVDDGWKVD